MLTDVLYKNILLNIKGLTFFGTQCIITLVESCGFFIPTRITNVRQEWLRWKLCLRTILSVIVQLVHALHGGITGWSITPCVTWRMLISSRRGNTQVAVTSCPLTSLTTWGDVLLALRRTCPTSAICPQYYYRRRRVAAVDVLMMRL